MRTKGYLFIAAVIISSQILVAQKKENIQFKSGDVQLSGTMFLPKGDGPFPAVVFVHGSGGETRENSRYSAKWFASIGYIALTYDKRGTGESGGDKKAVNRFNFDDLSDDVVAGIDYLKNNPKVDSNKIGIHASSQGGWVTALTSSKTKSIRFMIMRSASVCTVGEDRVYERSERLKNEGFTPEELHEAQEMQLVEAKTDRETKTPDRFTELFEKNKGKAWFNKVYPGSDPFFQPLVDYRIWYKSVVDFDPIPFLEKTDIPIFWIFGDPDLDSAGPVSKSISNLERLVQQGKQYEIFQYEGETHNVKESKYELSLYEWLCEVNDYRSYRFKKH